MFLGRWTGSTDGPIRFIERIHKSAGVEKILSQNPIVFFCLISNEDPKNDVPFDSRHFSKILIKNNILKKKMDPKLFSFIKSTCFLVFPKDKDACVTPNFIKWTNSLGINLLFVKYGARYYFSLISPIMNRKGIDSLTIVVKTITNVLGKANIIVDKINGVVCRVFKRGSPLEKLRRI